MIAIIDYDAGNLKSVEKAFLALGEECVVTRDHDSIRRADRVVLPGVGSFGTAMQQLKKYELDQVIREVVQEDKPFLGICLGLQLLFEGSEESDGVEGLHLLDGEIVKIPEAPGLKIPHIGWNSLSFPAGREKSPLLRYVEEGDYVYFVHSYYAAGCGEAPLDAPHPAILNAIYNATGVAIDQDPITPHVLFRRFTEEGLIRD